MGLQGVLNLAKNSLAHNQTAIQTIGHNISNASVQGYSRQEVVSVNNPPTTLGFGFLGTGVRVDTIRQIVDHFLDSRVAQTKSELSAYTAQSEAMKLAETFINEGGEQGGIGNALTNFFVAAEDLSTRPEGAPERTAFINAAQNVAGEFNSLAKSIEDLQIQANRDIVSAVGDFNDLVARVADLNTRIQTNETTGKTANDLRDERQRAVEQLGELMNISYFEDNEGAYIVVVGNGFPIVQKGEYTTVAAQENPDNVVGATPPVALAQIHFVDVGGNSTDITSRVTGGKIGGLLAFRDDTMSNLLDGINSLSATVANELNIIHSQGYGLDGSTGLNLFNPLNLTVDASNSNSVDPNTQNPNIRAVLSDSRVFDPTGITGANYTITFTSPTTFNVIDADTGLKLDETKVSVNGGPFGTDESVTSFTYSGSQTSIEFEGIRVVIGNFAGTPAADDSFSVSTRYAAARNMSLNSIVANDINKVAAAGAPDFPADNTTALAMADLRHQAVAERNSSTFSDYLNSIVSTFGTEARDVRAKENLSGLFRDTLLEARESVSGVSIDEEMANLIRYQQNFSASAQLMAIARDLLQKTLEIL